MIDTGLTDFKAIYFMQEPHLIDKAHTCWEWKDEINTPNKCKQKKQKKAEALYVCYNSLQAKIWRDTGQSTLLKRIIN